MIAPRAVTLYHGAACREGAAKALFEMCADAARTLIKAQSLRNTTLANQPVSSASMAVARP